MPPIRVSELHSYGLNSPVRAWATTDQRFCSYVPALHNGRHSRQAGVVQMQLGLRSIDPEESTKSTT